MSFCLVDYSIQLYYKVLDTFLIFSIPYIFSVSFGEEKLLDCDTLEIIGSYNTYDISLFFLHLSDGKLSALVGGTFENFGMTVSGGYRVYMLGG